MADKDGAAVDTVRVVAVRRTELPEGYWLGPAGERTAYWKRRAETAEARCQLLERELDVLRGRVK